MNLTVSVAVVGGIGDRVLDDVAGRLREESSPGRRGGRRGAARRRGRAARPRPPRAGRARRRSTRRDPGGVEREVERLLLGLGDVDHDDIGRLDALRLQHLQALVAADHVAAAGVDDDRLHQTVAADRLAEAGESLGRDDSRVVGRGHEVRDAAALQADAAEVRGGQPSRGLQGRGGGPALVGGRRAESGRERRSESRESRSSASTGTRAATGWPWRVRTTGPPSSWTARTTARSVARRRRTATVRGAGAVTAPPPRSPGRGPGPWPRGRARPNPAATSATAGSRRPRRSSASSAPTGSRAATGRPRRVRTIRSPSSSTARTRAYRAPFADFSPAAITAASREGTPAEVHSQGSPGRRRRFGYPVKIDARPAPRSGRPRPESSEAPPPLPSAEHARPRSSGRGRPCRWGRGSTARTRVRVPRPGDEVVHLRGGDAQPDACALPAEGLVAENLGTDDLPAGRPVDPRDDRVAAGAVVLGVRVAAATEDPSERARLRRHRCLGSRRLGSAQGHATTRGIEIPA